MSSKSSVLESFLVNSYHETNLPPLWQVLYQEAIRGHHLLFKKADIERYESVPWAAQTAVTVDIGEELEQIVMELLSCSDLTPMIDIIEALEDDERQVLYRLYQYALAMMSQYVRTQLN